MTKKQIKEVISDMYKDGYNIDNDNDINEITDALFRLQPNENDLIMAVRDTTGLARSMFWSGAVWCKGFERDSYICFNDNLDE